VIANTLVFEIYGFKSCPVTRVNFTPYRPGCVNTN
jgi:hypothetical protein